MDKDLCTVDILSNDQYTKSTGSIDISSYLERVRNLLL